MGMTVSSTLKMFDAMTGPLKNITSSMNMMISTMQKMQSATNKNVKVDKTLLTAQRQIAEAESEINKQIQQANRSHEKFNRTIKQGQSNTKGLLSTIKGMAAAYLTFQSAKQLGTATIGGAAQQQEMLNTFTARTGNEALGKMIYDDTVKQALKYGQDTNAALGGSMSFMSATMDPKQLTDLNKLAMRLAKLKPTEGLDGAAFAIKELLGGDYTSISERFDISRSMLKDSEARLAGMNGDVNGFIDGLDKLLNQQNLTEEAFEKMLDSPSAKWNRALQTFKFNMASAGEAGLQSLVPLFDRINEGFETGQFESTFDMLSWGVNAAVHSLLWLIDVATSVYTFFSTNWPLLEPIVYGLVGAFGALAVVLTLNKIGMWVATAATYAQTMAMFVQTVATNGLKIAWAGLNATMKANVFILVITGIIALAIWLHNLWETNDNFVAGFMRAWNALLNFFDQIPIFFVKIGVGIVNAFHDAKVGALMALDELVNGAIDKLNSLIQSLNSLGFISIDFINGVTFSAAAQIEAEAARQQGAAKIAAMQSEAAGKAAEREANVQKMLDDRAAKRAEEQRKMEEQQRKAEEERRKLEEEQRKIREMATNGIDPEKMTGKAPKAAKAPKVPKVDKVGQVDKIKGKVDISKDDIKMMRDVAEMKNIQYFTTLTPTVNVKTGNINNSGNLDSIVSEITKQLENEIASSAKGVYDRG